MSSFPIAPALASPTLHSCHICAAGQLWRALPETKKAKYKSGLICLAPLGQGGKRTWVQRWESDTILETLQEAIEDEHSAGLQDGIVEASVPFLGCGTVTETATETATRLMMAHPEHVTTAGIQQANPEWLSELYRRIDDDGTGRQGVTLTTSHTHESIDHGQGTKTPGQQALYAARQCMRRSHTDAEEYQVVRTLALSLGSNRPAAGTIRALQAVLMLLEQPEMSDEEAYTFTGASLTNFKRWRKQVQSLQSAHVGVSLA